MSMKQRNANVEAAQTITRRYFSEAQAAAYLGLSLAAIRKWRRRPEANTRPLAFHKLGHRTIRYLVEDLDSWMSQFRHTQKGK